MSLKQKIDMDETPSSRGDLTRENLVKTAMKIFARDGFDAASTRTIADEAGVNQALISYHFRNKNGLYLAVFEYIVQMMQSQFGAGMQVLNALIKDPNASDDLIKGALLNFCDGSIDILVSEEMTDKAKLILREQQTPTEAFDIVYDGFMGPLINNIAALVGRLRPDFTGEDLKIKAVTMFSQVIALRAARSTINRFLGWDNIGQSEAQKLKTQIRENFKLFVDHGGRDA